ncbi:MAG: hypothetical protein Q8O14_01275 [bacterium]|jgi:hypothetical protein|nr:hypothetical protein [bacterium]
MPQIKDLAGLPAKGEPTPPAGLKFGPPLVDQLQVKRTFLHV